MSLRFAGDKMHNMAGFEYTDKAMYKSSYTRMISARNAASNPL
jgi:hypothetical protein